LPRHDREVLVCLEFLEHQEHRLLQCRPVVDTRGELL